MNELRLALDARSGPERSIRCRKQELRRQSQKPVPRNHPSPL